MPFIGLSGEALRRHARVFRPRRGLQDVKEIEADRLLDLHRTALRAVFPDIPHLDVAATPEIGHVLLLRGEQLLEPLVHDAIHGPLGTAAEFLGRSRRRRVIDHVLGELDRTSGLGLDREGDLAEVLGVDSLVGVRARGLQGMVGGTRQGQPALFGRVAQHDPTILGVACPGMEQTAGKAPRLSRIVPVRAGARLFSHHLRRDHDGGGRVEKRHTVGDGGDVPVGEGDQTPGRDQHLLACRRLPQDLAVERPGLHVEPSLVAQQVRIGQPEGLVVDEELDDLAVGHAEDGLAGFREAIGVFGIYDRPGFIEPIDEGAVFGIGAAFLRTSAHAEVSVAERQHRFQLGQEFGVKVLFDDVPLVGRVIMGRRPEAFMMNHRAVPPETAWGWSVNQFAQIVHHQMCAMVPKLLGIALARDADHKPEVPGTPGLNSRDGILDDDRPCRLNPEQLRRHQERIRGGFSGQVLRLDHVAIDLHVEEGIQLGGL